MFSALRIVNLDGSLPEVDVFYPQFQGFALPQAASIHQLTEKFPGIFQLIQDPFNLVPRENGRWAAAAASSSAKFNLEVLFAMHMTGKENQGVESLLLSCGRHVSLKGKILQVERRTLCIEFSETGASQASQAEVSKTSNPAYIAFFSSHSESGKADRPTSLLDGIFDGLRLSGNSCPISNSIFRWVQGGGP